MLDAPNAAVALELATKHRGRIDLLQTDVVMRSMSGRELAKRLTAQRPVRVLYMSGYHSDLIQHYGILNTVLLETPFYLAFAAYQGPPRLARWPERRMG